MVKASGYESNHFCWNQKIPGSTPGGEAYFFFPYPYIGRAASITNISYHAIETIRDSILILIRRPVF